MRVAERPIPVPLDSLRFDVLQVSLEDGRILVIPDPRRYEVVEAEGEQRLFDRRSRLIYPWSVVEDMVRQASGVRPTGPSPAIDLAELVESRRAALTKALAAPPEPVPSIHLSDEVLASKVGGRGGFAVISVDTVGSTVLAARDRDAYEQLMPLLCTEIAAIAGAFGGFVANFAGDGGTCFFPPDGFCAANDAAFDAAIAIVASHYAAFIPTTSSAGLPKIDIRVGADSGELAVRMIGSPQNDRKPDIFGLATALATRIQTLAAPGEVWLGEGMAQNVHVTRQELVDEVAPPKDWPYESHDDVAYRVFRSEVIRRR